MTRSVRQTAVMLTEQSVGVSTEDQTRLIQHNGQTNGYSVTLNGDWLDQLELAEQSEATVHSMSMGMKPVIVQNPALIIQPADILDDDMGRGGLL